jgi:hypothetical protein
MDKTRSYLFFEYYIFYLWTEYIWIISNDFRAISNKITYIYEIKETKRKNILICL